MADWKNVQYKDGKFKTGEGGGGGSSTFAGLDDVSFNNLQNGQVPKYNSATQKWENANESGGGTVTDVQVDGASVVNPQGIAEIETPNADGIEYDNQQSGLSATDVQGAIDELAQGSGGGGVEDVEVNGTSVVNAQNVAEIKSYKEVTQAEYQALPSSKLTDNILYCIKDSAGADGFPPLIYSDEEREVGVWRDGKPLYQKTFSTNITSATQWIMTGLTNVERVITSEGSMLNSNNEPRTLPSADSSSIAGINTFIFSNGELACLFRTSNSDMRGDLKVTLRYTKTTDTPGSGTWTTQGGYAHHYSTTEQVIGTWIDGKPLYEKLITFTVSFSNQVVGPLYSGNSPDLSNYVSNIDKCFADVQHSLFEINGVMRNFTSFNYINNSNVLVCTAQNSNSNVTAKVTIQYTKTTD